MATINSPSPLAIESPIVSHVLDLSSLLENVSFSFISKQGNSVAHILDHAGFDNAFESFWYDFIPDCILDAVIS